MISTLVPWAWDDFTSAATDPIRTMSWQGGYCGTLASSGPPPAASIEFDISFSSDYLGRPLWAFSPQVRFTPNDAHEQFAFYENGCAYYDYTAVLPTPFPVTAGTRYWLLIAAKMSSGRWAWRRVERSLQPVALNDPPEPRAEPVQERHAPSRTLEIVMMTRSHRCSSRSSCLRPSAVST